MISLKVPGSKSITNRAVLLASMSPGKSVLRHALLSEDTRVIIRALKSLGVDIRVRGDTITLRGGRFLTPKKKIDCKNSGTTMRFLTAVLATQRFPSTLDGSARMRQRPMQGLAAALRHLGSRISLSSGGAPLNVRGPIKGGTCVVPGNISSQFISALLMAAPFAKQPVTIQIRGVAVSKPYIDLTVSLMRQFGVHVKARDSRTYQIQAPKRYKATNIKIEGDASAATYFWGLSHLVKSPIIVQNISLTTGQPDRAIQKILAKKLPRKISARDFPDGAMTLAAIYAVTPGRREITGLSTLRAKECDRLAALAAELTKIGAQIIEKKDALTITGTNRPTAAKIGSYNDHRMAMCFGMLSVVIPDLIVENPRCVQKTYPAFWRDLGRVKRMIQKRNIVFSGMRGSGKSTLAKAAAGRFKKKFIDIDVLIERRAGMPIARYVAIHGWRKFRRLEAAAVKTLRRATNSIISTGGGTLLNAESRRILKKNGIVVFLDCPVSLLKKRLRRDRHRPSLTRSDSVAELGLVLQKRMKLYLESADITVAVGTSVKANELRIARSLTRIGFYA